MSSVLVEGLTDVFKSQVLGPFTANFGETETSTVRGFQTGIGAMLTALASKVGQTGFLKQLSDLINSPANDSRVLDNARELVGTQPGEGLSSKFLSMLFGNKLSAVSDAIGSVSGLRGGNASRLLAMGAPMLLGMLGKQVHEGGMDTTRLTSYLAHEAEGIRRTLPAGIDNLIEGVPSVPRVAASVAQPRSASWLWPLLAVLALLGVLLWWLSARRPQVTTISAPGVMDWATRRLPGNIDLRIPVGRMEDHLLSFIQSSRAVDNTTWFDFDRLLFDTNSATLQPSSYEQVNNIAAILKAYPNANVKIGGYTDSTGDPNANMVLSQQRAEAVRAQLMSQGIAGDRMEAQGYGAQHPVADNSTEEGRQRNRRISMLVTQK